jgi:predicted MFS family arabinose efflux permease
MAIGAPLMAVVVGGRDRRRLLTLCMIWYGVLHLASAAAPDFASLLPLRVISMIAPAVFTPQAAACVGMLVPAHQRGRAITFIFVGWSVASVLGMPLSAYLGGEFGWRSAFAVVGVLCLASAVWVWRSMSDGVKPPALSTAAWGEVFRSRALLLCLAVTLLSSAGQFSLFSYFAPYFKQRIAITPGELSILFMWFGAIGLVGNVAMSRYIDRVGNHHAVMIGLGLMAASLFAWPLAGTLLAAAATCLPWALGCFSTNSAQQARLVSLAPSLASGSIALNTCATYAGQAVGAASGGWVIASGGFMQLHWAGCAGLVLAMFASAAAARAARR